MTQFQRGCEIFSITERFCYDIDKKIFFRSWLVPIFFILRQKTTRQRIITLKFEKLFAPRRKNCSFNKMFSGNVKCAHVWHKKGCLVVATVDACAQLGFLYYGAELLKNDQRMPVACGEKQAQIDVQQEVRNAPTYSPGQ